MKKILFLDSIHPVLKETLEKVGDYDCQIVDTWTKDEINKLLPNVYGIVLRSRFPMDADFLSNASSLVWIARSGAGMENIDEAYCAKRNITLFNAPEGNKNAVGEQALGMLLGIMNKLHKADRDVRNGLWQREENRGEELDGKTVGIIGFGNNGSAFAKKLRGFDVKCMAYDKYKVGFGTDFVQESTLQAILNQADVISFHIPQNEETVYFANQEFFDALGKSIYLLNLSRGKIVQTTALISAIETKKVKACALDVNEFENASFESFFDSELPKELRYLLDSDKVMLSPHIGGWTHESYFKLSEVLATKIIAFEQ